MELSNTELTNITGGGVTKWIIIGGAIAFAIGFIDGQARLKWQNLKNTELIGNLREKPLIQIRRKD